MLRIFVETKGIEFQNTEIKNRLFRGLSLKFYPQDYFHSDEVAHSLTLAYTMTYNCIPNTLASRGPYLPMTSS